IGLGVRGNGSMNNGGVALNFGPGARFLAVRRLEVGVELYEVPSGNRLRTLEIPAAVRQPGFVKYSSPRHSREMLFSPDGKLFTAVADDNTLGLWDVATGQRVGSLALPDGKQVEGGKFSPDGRCLALDVVSSPPSEPFAVPHDLNT